MDSKKPTMKLIHSYITKFINDRCNQLFKDFLTNNYSAIVQKNIIGDSEYTTPCITQIFNMCNKNKDWSFESLEETANYFIEDLYDPKKIIEKFKIIEVKSFKKTNKKDKESKKIKKEKNDFSKVYIDIYLNIEWLEEQALNIIRNGIILETEFKNKNIIVDFSSPNIAKEMHVGHLRSTILGESEI